MNLKEIMDDLHFGELSQISLGGTLPNGVGIEDYGNIRSHVERTLTILHRRFRLKEGRLVIPLEEGKTEYKLESDSLPVMKVEHVLWPDGLDKELVREPKGNVKYLPLNDDGADITVYTPKFTTMTVPSKVWEYGARELIVVYRGGHERLDPNVADVTPEEVEIDLPEAFREPLMLNIAAQIMNPTGPAMEGFHEGNNYAQKFEAACAGLENNGWEVNTVFENRGFQRSGFV